MCTYENYVNYVVKKNYLLENQNAQIMDTSFISELNWLAILVAAVAYFLVGGLWYSKALFGKPWMQLTGVNADNPEARKGAGGIMFMTFLLEFITCIALAILAYRIALYGVLSGTKLGLLTGVAFAAIAIAISYMYQMRKQTLTVIDAGYHIIGNIVAAIIICVWG
jgi:heme/copper-type cytochrome/quinol oxidase subunit 4